MLGFEVGNDELGGKLAQDFDNGGLFLFNNFEKKKIDESNKAGQTTSMLKRNDTIAYLIAFAYDLAIPPLDNISDSPGFELCLIDRTSGPQTVGAV